MNELLLGMIFIPSCLLASLTSCHSRYKLAFSQSRVASYMFDGKGYALVNNIERRGKFGIVTRFDIEVRTVANNGILFLMVNGVSFVNVNKTFSCYPITVDYTLQ